MDAMTIRRSKPILLVSPLPPPQGGIAVWTKKIIESGLPDGSAIRLVDTKINSHRNIFDRASLSIAEVTRTFRILSSLIYQIILTRPRIIHINCSLSPVGIFRDWICSKIAKLFNIPVVVHYHGNIHDFESNKFAGLSFFALYSLIKNARVNIVINAFSLKKAQEIQTDRIRLLPNFIEESVFNYPIKHFQKSRSRAIFAGGITHAKGCKEIFHLAIAIPEVDFYLFGKMHADMANLYRNLPANIFLQGEIPHQCLLNELHMSDFLLFPSYTEGFPLTVLEAMAMGIPVIATNVGAIPEMITEGQGGILVAPGDISALMNAIKKISQNQLLRQAMGEFNRKHSFKNYRYSVVIQQLIQIYDEIALDKQKCAV